MFMNSDPNSDSKQCPESKLGRVHSAHTHGPWLGTGRVHATSLLRLGRALSAVSWRTLGCIVVVPGRVAARTDLIAGRVAHASYRVVAPSSHDTKTVSRPNSCQEPCRALPRVSQRSYAVSQGAATSYRSLATSYRHTKRSPLATIQNLYHDSPHSQAARARCLLSLRAG